MTYEEIWQKIKRMGRDRKQLAYEPLFPGFDVQ